MSLQRKTVIVLIDPFGNLECWGSLKKACDAHQSLVYNTINKMKLPIEWSGFKIYRTNFNKATF